MLDERELKRLREGLAGSNEAITLRVRTGGGDPQLTGAFDGLAAEVAAAGAGRIAVEHVAGADLPAAPGLTIATGQGANLHYLALPEGQEAAPFVDLLLQIAEGAPAEPAPWAQTLTALDRIAEVLVFVGSACPHCAHTVRTAHQIGLARTDVTVIVVDAQRFPALAERYSVQAVPLTLLDRELTIVGPLEPADLAARIAGRDAPEHGAGVLLSLLESNRVDDAVMRVVAPGGAEELAGAWKGSTMTTRIGLMLVAEQVLEETPRALDAALPLLLAVLDSNDPSLRGDTADLLGQIGAREALPALEALSQDPHPDVAEIAADAVESIRGDGA